VASHTVHLGLEHVARDGRRTFSSYPYEHGFLPFMFGLVANIAIKPQGLGGGADGVFDLVVATIASHVMLRDVILVDKESILILGELLWLVMAIETAILPGLPLPLDSIKMALLAGHPPGTYEVLVIEGDVFKLDGSCWGKMTGGASG